VKLFKQPARLLSIFALVLSAVLLGNGGTAAAANPLLCFDGTTDTANGDTGTFVYGGHCTLNAGGTGATLDNLVTGPDGSYSGVYYAQSSLPGELLAAASVISFTYAAAAGTSASGGSPRISIGIDEDGNGTRESYAFVDTLGCNNGSANNGTLSFGDSTCTVSYTPPTPPGAPPVPAESWVNWAAFAAGHPTWKISMNSALDVPFVVADQPGLWTITNVQLGQEAAGVATKKDECKKGGWADMTRADGTTFKNQGDCIQYVNTGK
jgi:hypothetical protein